MSASPPTPDESLQGNEPTLRANKRHPEVGSTQLAQPYHAAFKGRRFHFVVRPCATQIGEKFNATAASLCTGTKWVHRVLRDVFTNLEAHLRAYAG
jgi:hypothetical protein